MFGEVNGFEGEARMGWGRGRVGRGGGGNRLGVGNGSGCVGNQLGRERGK